MGLETMNKIIGNFSTAGEIKETKRGTRLAIALHNKK